MKYLAILGLLFGAGVFGYLGADPDQFGTDGVGITVEIEPTLDPEETPPPTPSPAETPPVPTVTPTPSPSSAECIGNCDPALPFTGTTGLITLAAVAVTLIALGCLLAAHRRKT
jgi:hypothetical protein